MCYHLLMYILLVLLFDKLVIAYRHSVDFQSEERQHRPSCLYGSCTQCSDVVIFCYGPTVMLQTVPHQLMPVTSCRLL